MPDLLSIIYAAKAQCKKAPFFNCNDRVIELINSCILKKKLKMVDIACMFQQMLQLVSSNMPPLLTRLTDSSLPPDQTL